MKKIILHGELKEKYGESYTLAISSPAEGIRALCSQLSGFEEYMRDGEFYIIRGTDMQIDLEQLHLHLGKENEFHIIPAAAGGKKGGLGKAILGVAIIATAFIAAPAVVGAMGPTMGMAGPAFGGVFGASITWGNVALFGASMALQGIGSILTPSPKAGDYGARERAEERPSFIFNGAVNTVEQGQPVPIVYGLYEVGSVVISGALDSEQI